MDPAPIRLTEYSHGAGCACKLGPSELARVLHHLPVTDHPDLLVGMGTNDDAAAWRRPDGRAILATADSFTPIVDDAFTWGRIAAVNAASDVYAMGGMPLFSLNLLAWPRDTLPLDLVGEVLRGGAEAARDGGWAIVGGHSIDGPEPMYGMAVIGDTAVPDLLTNAGAREGDEIVLTKPIGTGLLATAVKRSPAGATAAGGWLAGTYTAAIAEMTRLNAEAARVALASGAHAATDVTGFGLMGHLGEMTLASALAAEVEAAAVPLLPGAEALVEAGFVSGGTMRNIEHMEGRIDGAAGPVRTLLCDAQTSGGLLLSLPAAAVDGALRRLADTGHTAARIGNFITGTSGHIRLV